MSSTDTDTLFEPLAEDEWVEAGGSGSTERGMYATVLTAFAESGNRYARIPMDRGPFKGKKASSVSTALKNSRDGKNAPDSVATIKVTSKGGNAEKGIPGVVFLENTAVSA